MEIETLISTLRRYVTEKYSDEATGHDWYHIERVTRNACLIAESEGGDVHVVEVAALLHDIDDHKFNGGDLEAGAKTAQRVMEQIGFDNTFIQRVVPIINKVSFKGVYVDSVPDSLEGKIVQDADRLDALGAIGIARAFAYGGNKQRPIYDPEIKPELHHSAEQYIHAKSHTINHFYEKLLHLKDKMNTNTGKTMAAQRHQFMTDFLAQFYAEWNN